MRVAITGASGHIGNNLARALLCQGVEVKALYHQDTRALEKLNLTRVHGSVLDPDSLLLCFQDVDVVYHLASVISIKGDPQGFVRRVNQEGTRYVVDACIKTSVQRLVHFSTIHALQQAPLEEVLDETRPLLYETNSIYDQSKAKAERIVLQAVQRGLDAVIVSPTGIIGPHDYKPSLMGRGLIALYRGSLPALVPGGFNWVDVRDVVQGSIQACDYGKSGERYILSGTWVSMRELAEMMEAISGTPRPKFTSPFWLARLGFPLIRAFCTLNGTETLYTAESLAALADVNRNISNQKARRMLNYHPRPIQETLKDTIDWFQQAEMLV